ncbi:ATP-dependent_RNA helicase [Hexamita inflata]|uniref:ATP-dependent RNA helicase n=1 Tax=Hexamita inflata TaxID=28002 RepID=A0AA86RGT6_9EUKA|nr:ATP-dependent RNA helicase [Hexamita inflata]
MNIDDISIDLPSDSEGDKTVKPKNVLQSLELQEDFLSHLKKSGFGKLTQIQEQALPYLVQDQDAIIISRTGSGKTLAFLIPLINKLVQHSQVAGVRGLILAPTRELAIQISLVLKKLVKYQSSALRIALVTGGDSLEEQFQALSLNPDVIVATPGRLLFHLSQIVNLQQQLKSVNYFVVDECDQMFEQQLQPQINEVTMFLKQPQTILTSATMPASLQEFSTAKLKNPKLIQNEPETFPEELFISNILVSQEFKEAALIQICQQISKEKTLIFMATKYHCEYYNQLLNELGLRSEAIYGSLDQTTRNQLLGKFRNNEFNILIATDVAARGVDIVDLKYVVNFNFPFNARMYLHRGGRCARNKQYGCYINIVEFSELPYLIDANIHVGQKLRVLDIESYLKFNELLNTINFTVEYNEDFSEHNKKLLKAAVEKLFESHPEQKEQLEEKYKKASKLIKQLNYEQFQQYVTMQTYMDNCNKLKLNTFSYDSFLNHLAVKSKLNNQIGAIPQQILDFKMQKLQSCKTVTEYNSVRSSMKNSLQQLNKQKKSATDASANTAKEMNLTFKQSKYYLINYFNQAKYEGVQSVDAEKQLKIIQEYKVPTNVLLKKAESGNKESLAMLKMRELMESKKSLKKVLQDMKDESLKNEIKPNLRYNNPDILKKMDEEIKQNKQVVQVPIIQNKPITDFQKSLNIEIQKDECENVKGQVQKKVWDPIKGRYVSPAKFKIDKKPTEKKVQNKKGEWVTVQEKTLYQKWTKKSLSQVKEAGVSDEVNDAQAKDQLRLQGLGRIQKRIVKQQLGLDKRTTYADKHLLRNQMDNDKTAPKKETKSQIIQKKAEEMKKKGVNWKDVKKQGRENNIRARTDFKFKPSNGNNGSKSGNTQRGKGCGKGGCAHGKKMGRK